MKVSGNGQARVLKKDELELLFEKGLLTARDKTLFAVCLFTACRISEALALKTTDIVDGTIIFRKSVTKGSLKTRSIAIAPSLKNYLSIYQPKYPDHPNFLFPGQLRSHHITRDAASKILQKACKRVSLAGVSTHSFRRTALTQMSNAGVPLRVIQEISGHSDLQALQVYLEVQEEQKQNAVLTVGWSS